MRKSSNTHILYSHIVYKHNCGASYASGRFWKKSRWSPKKRLVRVCTRRQRLYEFCLSDRRVGPDGMENDGRAENDRIRFPFGRHRPCALRTLETRLPACYPMEKARVRTLFGAWVKTNTTVVHARIDAPLSLLLLLLLLLHGSIIDSIVFIVDGDATSPAGDPCTVRKHMERAMAVSGIFAGKSDAVPADPIGFRVLFLGKQSYGSSNIGLNANRTHEIRLFRCASDAL